MLNRRKPLFLKSALSGDRNWALKGECKVFYWKKLYVNFNIFEDAKYEATIISPPPPQEIRNSVQKGGKSYINFNIYVYAKFESAIIFQVPLT